MKPALGVTEPGAIAFAVAKARSYAEGELIGIKVAMNSGMYKNAFTCGIRGSEKTGARYAAAFGYVAGDPERGLESLAGMTAAENEEGKKLVDAGKVEIELTGITSRIFIEATVETTEDKAVVTIRDSHTNIVCITVNGEVVYGQDDEGDEGAGSNGAVQTGSISDAISKSETEDKLIHRYTLAQLVEYADTVDLEEITFIGEAYVTNLALLMEGLGSDKTTFGPMLKKKNGDKLVSDDEQKTASLMCNGAIEARVIGLDKPAMSITGLWRSWETSSRARAAAQLSHGRLTPR
jgi:L-cysteine desulfidase